MNKIQQLATACFGILFCTTSSAQSYAVDYGDFGAWDTKVSVSLDASSNFTSIQDDGYSPRVETDSPISGTMDLYLNSIYSGTPASVKVDLSQVMVNGSTLDPYYIMTLDPNFFGGGIGVTNQLSMHVMDYLSDDMCGINPSLAYCLNFDVGNARISPFPASVAHPESSFDVVLDLGFISLIDAGNGTIISDVNIRTAQGTDKNISFSMLAIDEWDSQSYMLTHNPVPVPASLWLLLSGGLALFGYARPPRVK